MASHLYPGTLNVDLTFADKIRIEGELFHLSNFGGTFGYRFHPNKVEGPITFTLKSGEHSYQVTANLFGDVHGNSVVATAVESSPENPDIINFVSNEIDSIVLFVRID